MACCVCAWLPPVEGAADEELACKLARALDLPRRTLEIINGHASKTKLVRIVGTKQERLLRATVEFK
jgi:uncharacterized protein YggU (UPF0235/DUF167 family)